MAQWDSYQLNHFYISKLHFQRSVCVETAGEILLSLILHVTCQTADDPYEYLYLLSFIICKRSKSHGSVWLFPASFLLFNLKLTTGFLFHSHCATRLVCVRVCVCYLCFFRNESHSVWSRGRKFNKI